MSYAVQASNLDPSWCLKYNEKCLHPHTIPCFMSPKSPFEPLLGSRESPHASHPYTEGQLCPRCNQRRAVGAAWGWCGPTTPRRDSRTGRPARCSRKRAKPFSQSHCRNRDNRACLSSTLCRRSRWSQRIPDKPPDEQGLGVVQEARAWRPGTSRAAFPEDPKRSPSLTLNTATFETMKGHWT